MTTPDSRRVELPHLAEIPATFRKLLALWAGNGRPTSQPDHAGGRSDNSRLFLPGADLTAAEVELLVESGLLCRDVRANSRDVAVRLVLTRAGLDWVESVLGAFEGVSSFGGAAVARIDGPHCPLVRPHWHHGRRELTCEGILVKRLPRAASNQERILDQFEALGWPQRIDAPLPAVDGLLPSERVDDVVKRLNHDMAARLLLFGGDGTGTGICWHYVGSGSKRLSDTAARSDEQIEEDIIQITIVALADHGID